MEPLSATKEEQPVAKKRETSARTEYPMLHNWPTGIRIRKTKGHQRACTGVFSAIFFGSRVFAGPPVPRCRHQISTRDHMAQIHKNYSVNRAGLSAMEVRYVEQWEHEEHTKMAITSTREPNAFMLLHKTDFDPHHRVAFRNVIAFIFVPAESRRKGIAYDMLTTLLTYKLNLAAVANGPESSSLFLKAGFEKEVQMVGPIFTRDSVYENVGQKMTIVGLQTQKELNERVVEPISFNREHLRYECVVDGKGIRLKPINLRHTLRYELRGRMFFDEIMSRFAKENEAVEHCQELDES